MPSLTVEPVLHLCAQHVGSLKILAFFFMFEINCLADTWTDGAGFKRVATALSESSSIHSEVLFNLTKDMSGTGLEPMPYTLLEPRSCKEEPWCDEAKSLLQPVGFFFFFFFLIKYLSI